MSLGLKYYLDVFTSQKVKVGREEAKDRKFDVQTILNKLVATISAKSNDDFSKNISYVGSCVQTTQVKGEYDFDALIPFNTSVSTVWDRKTNTLDLFLDENGEKLKASDVKEALFQLGTESVNEVNFWLRNSDEFHEIPTPKISIKEHKGIPVVFEIKRWNLDEDRWEEVQVDLTPVVQQADMSGPGIDSLNRKTQMTVRGRGRNWPSPEDMEEMEKKIFAVPKRDDWRLSTAIGIQRLVKTMEKQNTHRKELYRIFKGLNHLYWRSGTFKVKSYVFVVAIFRELDKLPDDEDWGSEQVEERFEAILNRVSSALRFGVFNDYFLNKKPDLISGLLSRFSKKPGGPEDIKEYENKLRETYLDPISVLDKILFDDSDGSL